MPLDTYWKMPQVLMYVQLEDAVLDYGFYSRELSRLCFEKETALSLMRDKFSGHKHLCLIELNKGIQEGFATGTLSQDEQQITLSFSLIIPIKKVVFRIDAHVASCAKCEIRRSRKFRRQFLKYLAKNFGFSQYILPHTVNTDLFDAVLLIPYVVEIEPLYPIQKIDFAWCYRIEGQVTKKIILEDAMAWLSTLGGGYSSLGDYFQHHAEEAGRISVKQMRIAMEMGDPVVISKCRLFFAQSLMQRGYFDKAKQIIRYQRHFAKSLFVPDEKLNAMYRALRTRLKYLLSVKTDCYHERQTTKIL